MKVCECGCGKSMEGKRKNARYANRSCKTRHWKERTGYRLRATRKASQNPTRRPGVTVYVADPQDAWVAAGELRGMLDDWEGEDYAELEPLRRVAEALDKALQRKGWTR